jgi:sodium/proline symporter
MPHIIVRFMAIKNSKMVKKSATVAITWLILTLGAAIAIAWLGRTYILGGEDVSLAAKLLPIGSQSRVFIEVALDIFAPFIAGLMLAAIIAAAMSTADSQLLVASSSFTSDIYKPVIRKNASNKETLWIGRIVVLLIAVIAYFIASSKGSGAQAIMNMVENAWAGFGGSFGPVVLLSLFWKRLTYKGACAGVIVGAVVDVVWLFCLTGKTGIYEIIPAFICSTIVTVVVSLIDKKPSAEVEALFDNAVAECKVK